LYRPVSACGLTRVRGERTRPVLKVGTRRVSDQRDEAIGEAKCGSRPVRDWARTPCPCLSGRSYRAAPPYFDITMC